MGVNGLLTDVRWEWTGTELTADVLAGVTVLPVLDPTAITGGEFIWVADSGPYEIVNADEEGSTLTVTPALEIAADNGTAVANDVGGQPGRVWVGEVILDDAHGPIEVPLTIHDLGVMPEGTYDPPVTIILSNDLERVENLPGSMPVIDGTYIPPESLPPVSVSDGLPPTVSPAATVIGGIGALFVQWPTIANPDAVTYEVHLSLTDGFTPDASTLATEIAGTSTTLRTMPDGSSLTYIDADGTTKTVYYARIVAKDEDPGAAPPGVQGSGSMMQVTGPDVAANYVYAGNIIADQILAGNLNADIALLGSINIPPNIFINPSDGITVKQPDGRQTQLSADGTGNTFVGQGTFDAAEFMDQVTMRGVKNNLNGTMTLSSGVTDPSSVPSLTIGYNSISVSDAGYLRRGLGDSLNHDAWVTTDTVGGASNVQLWRKSDGVSILGGFPVLANWLASGVTRIGNIYYVAVYPTSGNPNYYILRYNVNTLAYMGFIGATGFDGGPLFNSTTPPAIGTDGVNVVLAFTLNGAINVRRYSTDTGLQVGNTLVGPAWTQTIPPTSVQYVGTLWYIGYYGQLRALQSTATTMTYVPASHVPLAAANNMIGAWHDGLRWTTFHGGKSWYQYTANDGTWSFGYTWYDNDTTGGSTTAETRISPLLAVTPVKFSRWTLTLPSKPPDDGTVDGANTAILYAKQGAGTLYRIAVLTEGQLSYTFDPLPLTGTAYVNSSGFEARPSTAFGVMRSTKQDGIGPLWELKGNGQGRVGPYRWDSDGKNLDDTGWIPAVFENGYSNLGGGWATAGYRRINGIVYLQGLLAGGTRGLAAFTMPPGFRPLLSHRVVGATTTTTAQSAGTAHTHGTAAGSFDVTPTGQVVPQGGLGNISISGVNFVAEQ